MAGLLQSAKFNVDELAANRARTPVLMPANLDLWSPTSPQSPIRRPDDSCTAHSPAPMGLTYSGIRGIARIAQCAVQSTITQQVRILSRCESRPATVAPAGSSRSGRWS